MLAAWRQAGGNTSRRRGRVDNWRTTDTTGIGEHPHAGSKRDIVHRVPRTAAAQYIFAGAHGAVRYARVPSPAAPSSAARIEGRLRPTASSEMDNV